jgi:transcriptional regulator with XRE-family HTH domain
MEKKSLQDWRKFRNITQFDMAVKMDMSLTSLSNYENYHTYPPIDIALKLVAILKISLDNVLWLKPDGD